MQLKCSVPLEVYAGIALDGLGHRSFSADLHVYALPRYAHQATHRWIESSPMGSCLAVPAACQRCRCHSGPVPTLVHELLGLHTRLDSVIMMPLICCVSS